MMGAGKTSAAITYMNEHPEEHFLFVTPYLTEIERIRSACPKLSFQTPSNHHSTKLEDLHQLLVKESNVVSTHALSEMIQWIWRSAIRRGEEIELYVPSRRMRNLLTDWLEKLSRE